MSTAQLIALENGGIQLDEETGPPNFQMVGINRANMQSSTTTLAYLFGDDGSGNISYITNEVFANNVPNTTFNGKIKGARFTSTNATSGEVQDWAFYHKASNTGSDSITTTSGNQITLLAAGSVGNTGTYSTNYAGLRILANTTAYSFNSVKGGTGSYRSFTWQTGASTTSQLTQDTNGNFYPTTSNQNTLGATGHEWKSGYFKDGTIVAVSESSSDNTLPIFIVTEDHIGCWLVNGVFTFTSTGNTEFVDIDGQIACRSLAGNGTGTITGYKNFVTGSGTSTRTLDASESGNFFTNTYNSGVSIWTLPAASSSAGVSYEISNVAASQALKIICTGSNVIAVAGLGVSTATTGYITLDTKYTTIKITCISTTEWLVTYQGTVTVV